MSKVCAQQPPYPAAGLSLWKERASKYGLRSNCQICSSCFAFQLPARGGRFLSITNIRHDSNKRLGGGFGLCRQDESPTGAYGLELRCRSRPRFSKPAFGRWFAMASVERSSTQPIRSNSSPTTGYLQLSSVNRVGENPNEVYFEAGSVSQRFSSSVALPAMIPRSLQLTQFSIIEQAFLLLGFIACMTSFALFALIITAIPTLNAMRKAAVSMEKLAEVAREELPGTMAAIRLSGMEISDLTLELNDLSQEISDGMKSSTRAVRAAEVGLRRMGSVAASQTLAMLQERASVPVEVVKPAVVSAAATTLQAVAQAQQIVLGLVSHPRSWLGRKANQEGKGKPINVATTEQSSSPTMVQTRDGTEAAAFEEPSLLPDEREIALYASSDAYLRPEESQFLLFDEINSDDEEEGGSKTTNRESSK